MWQQEKAREKETSDSRDKRWAKCTVGTAPSIQLTLLTSFGINTRTHSNVRRDEELAAAPPTWTGQTGYSDRSDRLPPARTVTNLRTLAREDPAGQAHVGLF